MSQSNRNGRHSGARRESSGARRKGTGPAPGRKKRRTSRRSWPMRLLVWGGSLAIWAAIGMTAVLAWYAYDLPEVADLGAVTRKPAVTLIAADGTVSFNQPGQPQAQQAGIIQLAGFQNPAGLLALGKNLFRQTQASGDPVIGLPGGQEGLGALQQGFLENSNVSVVEEFINMIISQRAYEANSRVVRTADEMYQQANALSQ